MLSTSNLPPCPTLPKLVPEIKNPVLCTELKGSRTDFRSFLQLGIDQGESNGSHSVGTHTRGQRRSGSRSIRRQHHAQRTRHALFPTSSNQTQTLHTAVHHIDARSSHPWAACPGCARTAKGLTPTCPDHGKRNEDSPHALGPKSHYPLPAHLPARWQHDTLLRCNEKLHPGCQGQHLGCEMPRYTLFSHTRNRCSLSLHRVELLGVLDQFGTVHNEGCQPAAHHTRENAEIHEKRADHLEKGWTQHSPSHHMNGGDDGPLEDGVKNKKAGTDPWLCSSAGGPDGRNTCPHNRHCMVPIESCAREKSTVRIPGAPKQLRRRQNLQTSNTPCVSHLMDADA